MRITCINQDNPEFPVGLTQYLSNQAPERISVLGNLDILKQKKTAFFCSSKCPGDLIIKTYDLAKKWRDDEVTVIGGFHSPMEQECLTILLRGKQPVIVCPARSIEGMRLKEEYKKPLSEGKLLMVSSFDGKERRATSGTSQIRNRLVAALADVIVIAHAVPSGKTEHLCREAQAWGKDIYTIDSEPNRNLIAKGVKPLILL